MSWITALKRFGRMVFRLGGWLHHVLMVRFCSITNSQVKVTVGGLVGKDGVPLRHYPPNSFVKGWEHICSIGYVP